MKWASFFPGASQHGRDKEAGVRLWGGQNVDELENSSHKRRQKSPHQPSLKAPVIIPIPQPCPRSQNPGAHLETVEDGRGIGGGHGGVRSPEHPTGQ